MHYGLALPNGGVDPQTMAEFAALAEASDWDGIFVEDYIVWQGDQSVPTYDPWVLLAAMAMRTQRVRLSTQITPLARRRPWKVAREAMTLDHLSNGRVILGKAFVESQRGTSAHYDISVGGSPRREDWDEERAYIRSLAEVSSTWWIEYVPPDDLHKMRACIARGPLRID